MNREANKDTVSRFSNRVEYYIKYRPKYPPEIIDFLKAELSLSELSVIADIGSGTGFLSELFLKNGNRVFGVEPGTEMREAAEKLLDGYPNFTSIEGRAEATGLESSSADFVAAGQAFHWFDVEGARKEFQRILKPSGWALLIWNDRKPDGTPFLKAYEAMLRNLETDYEQVNNKNVDDTVLSSFFGGEYRLKVFANSQDFDFEGLRGRLLSSSYTPMEGHPDHASMIEELRRVFDAYNIEGKVTIEYNTKLYYGRFGQQPLTAKFDRMRIGRARMPALPASTVLITLIFEHMKSAVIRNRHYRQSIIQQ